MFGLSRASLSFTSLAVGLALVSSGCRSRNCDPLQTIPACNVRNASCCDDVPTDKINFLQLRRQPPSDYVLGGGDTLGIYIQGITGDKDTPPPVHFPDDPGLRPALGYPVPIRDDGHISLPLIEPIRLSGLTLAQAEDRIRDAYTSDREILLKGTDKIIVTLMQRRTYNILVIREDDTEGGGQYSFRSNEVFVDDSRQGQTFSIELPAYENDILHALSETGGMPGEDAINEIVIIREGMNLGFPSEGAIVTAAGQGGVVQASGLSNANITRIPVEAETGLLPVLTEADITLGDGDVVFIEGRKRDVFYTGGLLSGGRFPLPRDYEIDVLEAISLAGGAAGASGSGNIRSGGVVPPTKVIIVRRANCQQCAIEVDLKCALGDASQRVIIQPGDMITLEYTQQEIAINTLVSLLQFGGIFRLIR